MRVFVGRRPSPPMAVACAALIVAVAGTAMAAPTAIKSVLNKQEKKQVKNIAKNQVNALAPGLSVAKANTANSASNSSALSNVALADLAPVALGVDSNCDPNTGGATFDDCLGATITTTRTSDMVVMVTASFFDVAAEPVGAQCRIEQDGADISADPHYGVNSALDVTADGSAQGAVAMNEAVLNQPAGTYTFNLACQEEVADYKMEGVRTIVYALGS